MENNVIVWEDEKQLAEIRKMVCSTPLTDVEFNTFIWIAKSTGLNPYLREIWSVKYGTSPASIFVGRDWYRKSAQAHRDYDYHQVDAVYTKDDFTVQQWEVFHKYSLADRGVLVWAYAVCKRKWASRANYVYVSLKEYNTWKSLWATKPETMVKKCWEAQVLRMTFQELFAGTYDESENWTEKEAPTTAAPVEIVESIKPKAKEITVTNSETGEVVTQDKISNKTRTDIIAAFKKLSKLTGWTLEESSNNMSAYLTRECKDAAGKPVANLLFISEEQAQKMLGYINDKIAGLTPAVTTEPESATESEKVAEETPVTTEVTTDSETITVEEYIESKTVTPNEAEAVFEETKLVSKYKNLQDIMIAEVQVRKDFNSGLIPAEEKDRRLEVLTELRKLFI